MQETGARIKEVISTLERQVLEIQDKFDDLPEQVLNWKPAKDRWSVAQCFDHLITTHSLYFPVLEAVATGSYKPSFWESNSPLSGFWGRYFVQMLRPDNVKKVKTTKKAFPASSQISRDILQQYAAHQKELVTHIEAIASHIDLEQTIVTSPLLGFITYSLGDVLTILEVHGDRHILQAQRVYEQYQQQSNLS